MSSAGTTGRTTCSPAIVARPSSDRLTGVFGKDGGTDNVTRAVSCLAGTLPLSTSPGGGFFSAKAISPEKPSFRRA